MASYSWVQSNKNASIPQNAVKGGHDIDGSEIFVGKTTYKGDELPCKVIPSKRAAYVAYNGKEEPITTYQVMVKKKLKWIKNKGGTIPRNAVPGGRTSGGETLYIGRVNQGGSLCIGKVHPSHGSLYIPFDGKELSFKDYEILVEQ